MAQRRLCFNYQRKHTHIRKWQYKHLISWLQERQHTAGTLADLNQLWSSVDRTHFHHEKKWPFSSLKMDALITGLTWSQCVRLEICLGWKYSQPLHSLPQKTLTISCKLHHFPICFSPSPSNPASNMAPASSVGPNDWEIQRLWDEDRSTCHPCYASAPDILVATFPQKIKRLEPKDGGLEEDFFRDFLVACLFLLGYIYIYKVNQKQTPMKIIRYVVCRWLFDSNLINFHGSNIDFTNIWNLIVGTFPNLHSLRVAQPKLFFQPGPGLWMKHAPNFKWKRSRDHHLYLLGHLQLVHS